MSAASDHVPWLDRLDFLEEALKRRHLHSHRDRRLYSFAADIETLWTDIQACLFFFKKTDGNFNDPSAEQARLLWWNGLRPRTIARLGKIVASYKLLVRTHRLVEFIPDPPLPELQPRVRMVGTQMDDIEEAEAELRTFAKHNRPISAAEFQREVDHLLGRDKPDNIRRRAQEARKLGSWKVRKRPPPDVARGAAAETES